MERRSETRKVEEEKEKEKEGGKKENELSAKTELRRKERKAPKGGYISQTIFRRPGEP